MRAHRLSRALAAASLFAAGCAPGADSTPDVRLGPLDGAELPAADLDRVATGETAPDFRLAALGGDVVRLSDFRGSRDVVLVFYRGHW